MAWYSFACRSQIVFTRPSAYWWILNTTILHLFILKKHDALLWSLKFLFSHLKQAVHLLLFFFFTLFLLFSMMEIMLLVPCMSLGFVALVVRALEKCVDLSYPFLYIVHGASYWGLMFHILKENSHRESLWKYPLWVACDANLIQNQWFQRWRKVQVLSVLVKHLWWHPEIWHIGPNSVSCISALLLGLWNVFMCSRWSY